MGPIAVPVSALSKTVRMVARVLPALLALAGTAVQMWLSLRQVALSHRQAILRKDAEDELIKELIDTRRTSSRKTHPNKCPVKGHSVTLKG